MSNKHEQAVFESDSASPESVAPASSFFSKKYDSSQTQEVPPRIVSSKKGSGASSDSTPV